MKKNNIVNKAKLSTCYKLCFLVVLLSFLSCTSQNCSDLKSNFRTYTEAQQTIRSTSFNVKEKIRTPKSSWILSSEYYSCDKKTGYLIIQTEKQNYVHQNVPIGLWKEFKKAKSAGQFYNSRIKGRYRLSI